MSDVNNELVAEPQKQATDIDQLYSKYDGLSKVVNQLENNKSTIVEDLKQINTSIDEILLKLNKLSDEHEKAQNEVYEKHVIHDSMKKIFAHPLRKIAVSTLTAVYAVADSTIEKASNLRESLEDIVAEAQYSNKKKKMPPMENN